MKVITDCKTSKPTTHHRITAKIISSITQSILIHNLTQSFHINSTTSDFRPSIYCVFDHFDSEYYLNPFHNSLSKGCDLTNKKASTVLCSVVKDAGSGRTLKKCRGKHETHFLNALPLPKCFTAEHSTSRGFFICFMAKNSIISPRIRLPNFIFQRSKSGVSRVRISDKAR